MGKISLRYCEDYKLENIKNSLNKAFEDIGGLSRYIPAKSRVMLKCNLSSQTAPDVALTTHPAIVTVLADMIEGLGASCLIVDSPKEYSARNVDKMYEVTKMLGASNQGHAQLNTDFNLFQTNISGHKTTKLVMLDMIKNVDLIINIPKLVVNIDDGLNGCVNNLFGLVASEEQKIVRESLLSKTDFIDYQLDVYNELKNKVVLNIVDGVVSKEANNSQRILNLIMVGENSLEMDYKLLEIVGINPKDNLLIKRAKLFNLLDDESNISSCGDNLDTFKKKDFSLPSQGYNIATYKINHDYKATRERPKVKITDCKGCKKCFSSCPTSAISEGKDANGEIYARLDLLKCIHCMNCVKTCPYGAIKVITPIKYKHLKQKIEKRLVNKN